MAEVIREGVLHARWHFNHRKKTETFAILDKEQGKKNKKIGRGKPCCLFVLTFYLENAKLIEK